MMEAVADWKGVKESIHRDNDWGVESREACQDVYSSFSSIYYGVYFIVYATTSDRKGE